MYNSEKKLDELTRDELLEALSISYQKIWELNRRLEVLIISIENTNKNTIMEDKTYRKKKFMYIRKKIYKIRDFIRIVRRKLK